MEITITYETLFDLLRKERSLDELQPLAKDFWSQVVSYLKEREEHVAKASTFEHEKGKIQLENIKRIIKEIYERREQKIVRLAVNVTRTKTGHYVDKRNMLATEQAYFDEQVALLKKYSKGVLLQLFNGELPTVTPAVLPTDEEPASTDAPSARTIDPPVRVAKPEENEVKAKPVEKEVSDAKPPVQQAKTPEDQPTPGAGTLIVRFTTNVPKFVGKNKQLFGPYEKGKIAQLPAKIAQILLKKGKVEHVMANA